MDVFFACPPISARVYVSLVPGAKAWFVCGRSSLTVTEFIKMESTITNLLLV